MFSPKPGFDEQLLSSIPKKIFEWLMSYGVDPVETVNIGPIIWSEDADVSRILFRNTVITWSGKVMEPTSISTNVELFAEASKNLSAFVTYEKQIYEEVEQFIERRLNEQQLLQTLQA
jgi:hypothetical protein